MNNRPATPFEHVVGCSAVVALACLIFPREWPRPLIAAGMFAWGAVVAWWKSERERSTV